MNNGVKFIFTFSLGAAAGAVVSWRYLKQKYEQITREEIASYKEACSNKQTKTEEEVPEEKAEEEPVVKEEVKKEYRELLQTLPYGEVKEEVAPAKEDGPYVIAPEDFDEYDDYEIVSLTYYDDGILANENDEIVEDVEELIGADSLNRFGEYEDDSVYVRDERIKTDYEILRDRRNYTDVVKRAYSSETED